MATLLTPIWTAMQNHGNDDDGDDNSDDVDDGYDDIVMLMKCG